MKWRIHHQLTSTDPVARYQEIMSALNNSRDVTGSLDISSYRLTDVGIDPASMATAVSIIQTAIKTKQPILIYGDYDADGITATAILYEALHALGALATPFIPSREKHGYGLSIPGLETALASFDPTRLPLVITVDNGIVANASVDWLNNRHVSTIITDHHQKGNQLPAAQAIVHSSTLCGAGVAWFIAQTLSPETALSALDLVCIGTIADMIPLTGINRAIVKQGLPLVRSSTRPGIQALLTEAGIADTKPITPTDVNYGIAPRLNAMGRLEHAIDSLRLLCTKNTDRAQQLASLLGSTNRNRQELTQTLLDHAKLSVVGNSHKIIIIDHDDYHEGIIGLIAGKLVETYYRPAIVISKKPGVSKASARSIQGVNITELIRTQAHLLVGVGGHPMAAGFSIETEKIPLLRQALSEYANTTIDDALLEPSLEIDCDIHLMDISTNLYYSIQELQPFGIGNPVPVFANAQATILNSQVLGSNGQHLKLLIDAGGETIEALWFGHGAIRSELIGKTHIDLAFTLDQNTWRNRTRLQLLIKDINL